MVYISFPGPKTMFSLCLVDFVVLKGCNNHGHALFGQINKKLYLEPYKSVPGTSFLDHPVCTWIRDMIYYTSSDDWLRAWLPVNLKTGI